MWYINVCTDLVENIKINTRIILDWFLEKRIVGRTCRMDLCGSE
jgi:hypothetical protein